MKLTLLSIPFGGTTGGGGGGGSSMIPIYINHYYKILMLYVTAFRFEDEVLR